MTTQYGYDHANYYVWRTPDGFSIHVSLRMVRELSAQISPSGETCGILLGRAMTTPFAATIADDFLVIAPSEDFETARSAAENDGRGLRAIGYFRSHHDSQMKLDARDLQTFDKWFNENGNVGLLIQVPRHGDSEAALFYWQDGQARPREFGFGFPFDAARLADGHPGWRFPDPLEPAEKAPLLSALRQTLETPAVAPSDGIRWARLLPTAALVVIAIIATQALLISKRTKPTESPATEAAKPAPASARVTPLGLQAISQPRQMEIRWNPVAPAILSAVRGTMSISGAGITDGIRFDTLALREGYIDYTPKANDLHIRFEVRAANGVATTESIQVAGLP